MKFKYMLEKKKEKSQMKFKYKLEKRRKKEKDIIKAKNCEKTTSGHLKELRV